MKVAELQSFVKTLVQPLSSVGVSKTVCTNLEDVAAALEPFRDLSLSQLADFLAKAEEFQRTGVLATPAKPARARAAKASPLSVAEAVQKVRDLYERAADPTLTYAAIDAEIQLLNKALLKDPILAVATEMGIVLTQKTKKGALEEIQRLITDRKGSFERTQFRSVPAAPVAGLP